MSDIIKEQKIKDVFFTTDVLTCTKDSLISEVAALMEKNKVGAVVVTDKSQLVEGIFTERDFLNKAVKHKLDFFNDPISKHMTPNPKTVILDSLVTHSYALMRVGKFRHVIVVDHFNKLVGIFSIRDAFFHLCDEILHNVI